MYRKKRAFAMAVAMTAVMTFGLTIASASSAVLKKESHGNEVTALQKDLIRLGYLTEDATGYFGNATEIAVKKVQKEYGYDADGIAGEITLSLVDRLRGRSSTKAVKSAAMVGAKTSTATSTITSKPLKSGDENSSVIALQKSLIKLGYLNTNATGYYGTATEMAVKKLQKKYGYKADGVAGSAMLTLIGKLVSGKSVNAVTKKVTAIAAAKAGTEAATAETATAIAAAGTDTAAATAETVTAIAAAGTDTEAATAETDENTTEFAVTEEKNEEKSAQTSFMPKWYGSVEKTFSIGETATVYDIGTGLSFKIKRTYGHNHADCETLTAKDTAIMKKIYDGNWNWDRRAIIISVDGLKIAASMAGFPHAGTDKYAANKVLSSRSGGYGRGVNLDAVKDNNMNGAFDVHFLGSRNHYNNKADPKHQNSVKSAAKWAEQNYK